MRSSYIRVRQCYQLWRRRRRRVDDDEANVSLRTLSAAVNLPLCLLYE